MVNWRDINRRYEAGVWAVPLALFPAFFCSAAFGQPSCIEPVVELIFAYTPVSFANVALNVLGSFARPLALIGAIALTLPLGGLLGMLAPAYFDPKPTRRQTQIRWATLTLAAIGASLWLGSAAPTPITAITAIIPGLLFSPLLLWTRTWRHPTKTPTGRRQALRVLLGTPLVTFSLIGLSSYEFWSTLAIKTFALGNQVRLLFPFVPPKPRQPDFPVAAMEPEVTPIAQFYVNDKDDTDPLQLAEDWTLSITGLVRNPLTLTYQHLFSLPRTDLYATMRCVDNPVDGHLMSTALWSGVPMAKVLAMAQPLASANTIMFHAADTYNEPFPLTALSSDAALLAYGMNGETLTQVHGAPVRALLPGWYGFRNIKWLQGIELASRPIKGYWESTGWTAAQIHPVARIDVAQILNATSVLVAGVAYGGTRGISAVQVRVNDGAWIATERNVPALSPYAWVQWRVVLPVKMSQFRLTARMIDASGLPQDGQSQQVYPGGSSGLSTVEVKRS
jgi:DMSO/TMAO reductase YedYZ molybdopterin-dependent catalytic subunit